MYEILGKKITNEQFDFRIKETNFYRVGDYLNSKTSIKFGCKLCNKIFKKKPKEFNLLKCDCNDKNIEYKKLLEIKNLTILDKYINIRTKINHKCLICNNIFLTSPKTIKNNLNNCSYCSGVKISNKDYMDKLPIDIINLEKYTNSYTKIEHKCLVCNDTWKTKPNYILHMGCGCPFCSSSKGERIINNLLNSLNIEFQPEKAIIVNNKIYYFDFYIKNLNLIIEFDGIQHFESVEFFGGEKEFIKIKENDEIKNNFCENNAISLIRIPYYNINDIEEIIFKQLNITKL